MVTLNNEKPIEILLDDLVDAYNTNRGWSLVRCGDSEWITLVTNPATFDDYKPEKGHPSVFTRWEQIYIEEASLPECQRLLSESFREADWMGILERNDWARNGTIQAFTKWYLPEPKNQIYWWISLYLSMYRDFMDLVMTSPLFITGVPGELFSNKLEELGHKHPRTISPLRTPVTLQDYQQICSELEAFDGRLCLITLGVWGKPLCQFAKSIGKIGIDVGNSSFHIGHGFYHPNITGGYGREGYNEHLKSGAAGPIPMWAEDGTRNKLSGEEY